MASAPRIRPLGSRPAPSHSNSSQSVAQRLPAQSQPISLTDTVYLSPSAATDANQSLPPASSQPSSSGSLYPTLPPPITSRGSSRGSTPRPKLALSLKVGGGGVAGAIGAPDPDEVENAPPAFPAKMVLPPLNLNTAPITLESLSSGSLGSASSAGSASPSIRPPSIGGRARPRPAITGLRIPVGSMPLGAIGADDPDMLSEPLVLSNDMDDAETGGATIKPLNPQHQRLGSLDELKRVITPSSATHPSSQSPEVASSTANPNQTHHSVTGSGLQGAQSSTPSENVTSAASQRLQEELEQADEYLEDISKLGEGAGGEVYKVRDKRTGKILARKIIQARSTPAKQLMRELNHLRKTDHPNIIKCYGAYISPSSSELKVLMEFSEGGSLEAIGERIKRLRGRVSEKVAGKIAEGIFKGLNYLYSLRIIHRDIKPSNILLSKSGVVKLCDFGVSGELVDSFAATWTGTGFYMAPERISGGLYTIRSDVWSSGLTLLTLAQNRFPYPDDLNGIVELVAYLASEEPPQLQDEEGDDTKSPVKWSDGMKDFIRVCLTRDSQTRPTPQEVLQHPWLVECQAQRVDMARWIRDVWGWEPPRGRPRPDANAGGLAAPGDESSRRPSAVRGQPSERRDSSAVRITNEQ